ncbi:MAG: endonuclease/exonuclease/phosphatase family protein [Jiangellaceae bacterium]|nr:endonuclease/exonuclease/phosphatase family protein [Jiangellaceae bacterium]
MPTGDAPSGRLRILTLNLWAHGGEWRSRRGVLVDGLRELQPDLIAFQEAIRTDTYDQAAELLAGSFAVEHQTARDPDAVGLSVASRWPIVRATELDLHVTPNDFPCATLTAEVAVPPPIGPVLFVNHNPSWQLAAESEREVQAVAAARSIDDAVAGRDMHVVVAGDLDADPDAGSIRFWTGRQAINGVSVCYRDAWESAHPGEPGHTFSPQNPLMADAARDWPFRRIDYVFVRCSEHAGSTLVIEDCDLVFNEPVDGVWASDHFGVFAQLRVPGNG